MSDFDSSVRDLVLDAPIVVHVEVCSLSMSARDWSALRPGDVVETGARLAEPAVLRISGRPVGRAELVSIDGELGVRITERFDEGDTP